MIHSVTYKRCGGAERASFCTHLCFARGHGMDPRVYASASLPLRPGMTKFEGFRQIPKLPCQQDAFAPPDAVPSIAPGATPI
ncbi:hypothetical protein MPLB_110036 [Mesorhizobium sp. ORS 3324]|nr:hypothetical protein MPLB_110036 [Mesorhizobium sp. ORS 3324]